MATKLINADERTVKKNEGETIKQPSEPEEGNKNGTETRRNRIVARRPQRGERIGGQKNQPGSKFRVEPAPTVRFRIDTTRMAGLALVEDRTNRMNEPTHLQTVMNDENRKETRWKRRQPNDDDDASQSHRVRLGRCIEKG